MVKLKDKVQNALDEARMLILGSQVLLGFQFRSILETGFEKLPRHAQFLKLGGLGLMVIAIALLMWPGALHRIVESGEDTRRMHRFTTRVMEAALLPFACGLGIDAFVAGERLYGTVTAAACGMGILAVALFFWYGLEAIHRTRHAERVKEHQAMNQTDDDLQADDIKLKDKIRQVLTEARVVLPGAQALLGFQFAAFLMESFDKLPGSSKAIHSLSLALVALSIIFLMTPAAYHRIVEQGEDTEHFHRFAGRALIAAMIPLALGITGDLFVAMRKVTDSAMLAGLAALLSLMTFYGMWFGYTMYRRTKRREGSPRLREF
jgi:hypothetical protein